MKIKTLLFLLLLLFTLSYSNAQTVIKMEKAGGVYKIPCKVNGLSLKFIFDTGASDVTLSLTEALFMLKNGFLNDKDFLGTEYYRIANGDIQEGTKVNLKIIEIEGLKIYNVQASIVHTTDAPLLMGQSALQRFGKLSIDYSTNTLSLGSSQNNVTTSTHTKTSTPDEYGITCRDIDGNIYATEIIGYKVWMAENLKTTRYNNGDTIIEDNTIGYVDYRTREKDKRGKISQGHLYNWYAISEQRNICPKGWRIPSREDVVELAEYYGLVGDKNEYSYGSKGNVLVSLFSEYDRIWTSTFNGSSSSFLFVARPAESRLSIYYKNKDDFYSARCIKDLSEQGYYESGMEKAKLGDYNGAIDEFTEVIKINPNNARAYYNRGLAKSHKKNFKEAVDDLSKAIIIDLTFVDAWVIRGIILSEDIEDYKGAIKDFSVAIKLNPNDADIFVYRGNAKAYLKEYKSAIDDFNKAIEINVNHGEAYYYRGISKCILGLKEDGCWDLNRSLDLDIKEAAEMKRKLCK